MWCTDWRELSRVSWFCGAETKGRMKKRRTGWPCLYFSEMYLNSSSSLFFMFNYDMIWLLKINVLFNWRKRLSIGVWLFVWFCLWKVRVRCHTWGCACNRIHQAWYIQHALQLSIAPLLTDILATDKQNIHVSNVIQCSAQYSHSMIITTVYNNFYSACIHANPSSEVRHARQQSANQCNYSYYTSSLFVKESWYMPEQHVCNY